jgi:hypothetical protein
MAVLHRATLSPEKLELLAAWLPGRAWGGSGDLRKLGAYRFDDPAGEVGVETFLLQRDDGVRHVPLTYRGAPLEGAEAHLVGTTEHSVLGPRWVYDGCADPVWATTLATAVLTGGTEVELFLDVDGELVPRKRSATVRGSGTPGTEVPPIDAVTPEDDGSLTVVRAGALELVVVRVVGADVDAPHTLTGSWRHGGSGVLAGVRPA